MRQDIEKIIQDAASWNLVQNGIGKWSYNNEYPFELDQAVDQILELIKKKLPSRGMLDNRYTKAKVGDRVFVSVDELLDKLEDKS